MSGELDYSYLIRLAPELIEWIGEFIPSSSRGLLILRILNKDMLAKTQDVVARTYFSDRAFLIYYPPSLHTLYEISQHPVFFKSMKCIQLSVAKVQTSRDDYRWRKAWAALRLPDERTPRRKREDHRAFRRNHQQLLKAQNAFIAAHMDARYMFQILCNFKDVGNIPEIIAPGMDFQPDNFHTTAWEYRHLSENLGTIVV